MAKDYTPTATVATDDAEEEEIESAPPVTVTPLRNCDLCRSKRMPCSRGNPCNLCEEMDEPCVRVGTPAGYQVALIRARPKFALKKEKEMKEAAAAVANKKAKAAAAKASSSTSKKPSSAAKNLSSTTSRPSVNDTNNATNNTNTDNNEEGGNNDDEDEDEDMASDENNNTNNRTNNDMEGSSSNNAAGSSSASSVAGGDDGLDPGLATRRRKSSASSSSNAKSTWKRATKKLYCICQQPYNRDLFYIGCEACDGWFHGSCVNVSENMGAQIEKWFCTECLEKKGDALEIKFRPKCVRESCLERVRSESAYCSEACGLLRGQERLAKLVPGLPILAESRKELKDGIPVADPYRMSAMDNLAALAKYRPIRQKLIRALEMRQILIDECIERSRIYKSQQEVGEKKICGFDERIFSSWDPSTSFSFLETFDKQPVEAYFVALPILGAIADKENPSASPSALENICESDGGGSGSGGNTTLMMYHDDGEEEGKISLNKTVCMNGGKCPLHQGWEFTKTKEAELDLQEEIKLYCIDMQREMELKLRLLPKLVAIRIGD